MTMTDTWAPLGPAAGYPACRCAYCLQAQQARPPCGCPDCLRKWSCDSLGAAAAANSVASSASTSASGNHLAASATATPPIASAAGGGGLIPHGWSSTATAQFIQQQQHQALPPLQQTLAPPTHLQTLQPPHPVPQPQHNSQQQQQQQHHVQTHPQQQRSPHFLMSSQAAAATDPASSDEALSPLHQEDMEDAMGMKEASKLQQEIVKAWKQKKRPSCEMKTRTQDKYRQVYSSNQRFELEKEYHFQKYISTARKSELSRTLRLSERQIKIWFQNRRAKERRQKKNQQRCDLQDSPPSTPDLEQFGLQDGGSREQQQQQQQQLVKQEGR